MATTIELAERKGKARAYVYLVFAGMIPLLLLASHGPVRTDFFRGMWLGLTLVATLNLLPWGRWLKPGNAVVRMLDDESAREHRRMSGTAGFAAAMASALMLTFITAEGAALSPTDVAQTIATAAMMAFLIGFATLELRAARD